MNLVPATVAITACANSTAEPFTGTAALIIAAGLVITGVVSFALYKIIDRF